MTTTSVHEAAMATFGADDQAGRGAPKVHAELANGRARLSAGPFNWDADLPAVVGGGNQAPSPTAYLLGALSACAVAFTHDTLASEFGVTIETLSADASCTADVAGLVGMPGRDPRLQDLSLTVTLAASPAEAVTRLQTTWEERCPIYLALGGAEQVQVTWVTPA